MKIDRARVLLLVAIIATACTARDASAAILFTSLRSVFDAAAPGITVQTIPNQRFSLWSLTGSLDSNTNNALGIAPGDIAPGLSIDSQDLTPGQHSMLIVKSGWVGNTNNAVHTGGLNLNLRFAPAVDAIGLGLLNFFGDSDVRVRLYDAADILLAQHTAVAVRRGGTGTFLGILAQDGERIARVNLYSTALKNAGVDRIEFGMQSPVSVPAPLPGLLLAFAMAAAAAFPRRSVRR